MGEVWRKIPEYLHYEVSSTGKVYSWYRGTPRELKQFATNEYGHLGVSLSYNGKVRTHRVSRLVASAFLSNPGNKPEVAHKDGDFTNNDVTNLRWATHAENMADRVQHGTSRPGELAAGARLTEQQVREIRETYVPRVVSQAALAERYGVSRDCIQKVVSGATWRHI